MENLFFSLCLHLTLNTHPPQKNKMVKKKEKPRRPNLSRTWKGLKPKDLTDISQKIKDVFKWKHEPRPFQIDAVAAQLKCEDVLIHAGTGSGKTAIAAGPHAHEKTKGMVTFMISPLIVLQEEQVSTRKCSNNF
jgi:ATP-dependent helicase YprA (DUF1998 family)